MRLPDTGHLGCLAVPAQCVSCLPSTVPLAFCCCCPTSPRRHTAGLIYNYLPKSVVSIGPPSLKAASANTGVCGFELRN